VEYQRIGVWRHVPAASTDARSSLEVRGSWNAAGMFRRVVFGTLLGPEATGPGFCPRDLCFWFPGCTDHTVASLAGVVCVGCVVRGCCLRTT